MKKLLLTTALVVSSFLMASDEQKLGQLMQSLDSYMQTLINQARMSSDAALKALANEVDNTQKSLQNALAAQKNSKAENPSADIQGMVNNLGKKMDELLRKAKVSSDAKIKQTAEFIEKTRQEIDSIFARLDAQKGQQLRTVDKASDSNRTLKKVK